MLNNKILVPVDFSDCSANALRFAATLAEDMHTSLLLLYAFRIPLPIGDAINPILTPYQLEKEIYDRFEKFTESIYQLNNLVYETKVIQGFAAEAIISAMSANETGMIVMGTTGASGLSEVFLGSVTAEVINNTSCPVLAIPENASLPRNINCIALASDYSKIDIPESIKVLRSLAKTYAAEIKVLNVCTSLESTSIEQAYEAKHLDEYLNEIKHSFHSVTSKNILEGIDRFTLENDIDMLAMIHHRRHNWPEKLFKRSITRKMAFHTKIPLLSLQSID